VAFNRQLFQPFPKLRWCGYWFVPNFASSAHFSHRLALSHAAFAAIRCHSSYGSWVSPHLCYRLPFSLLFPILSSDADLFVPSKGLLSKMEIHSRQVQHWVSNCFLATPLPILAPEAYLPLLAVLLYQKRQMAALRLVCSPPQINPASPGLCRSLPSLLKFCAPDSYLPSAPDWTQTLCHSTGKTLAPLPQPGPTSPERL